MAGTCKKTRFIWMHFLFWLYYCIARCILCYLQCWIKCTLFISDKTFESSKFIILTRSMSLLSPFTSYHFEIYVNVYLVNFQEKNSFIKVLYYMKTNTFVVIYLYWNSFCDFCLRIIITHRAFYYKMSYSEEAESMEGAKKFKIL